jgi:hypothetical protein
MKEAQQRAVKVWMAGEMRQVGIVQEVLVLDSKADIVTARVQF